MSTSPSSGLSAEAKEFVPLISPSNIPSASIPLYVDENTVASIYPSDHQPLMVQTIYPMMITNSKGTDNMQFPEIEFHIQTSQQQAQFHIDSQTSTMPNGNGSTGAPSVTPTTSQIVLLPTTNSVSGFYSTPQILYSPNDSMSGYYPIDYCEPSLINFSVQQPNPSTKSSRISSQQSTRGNTFRQQHGAYRSSTRANHRAGSNSNRNSYYDYSNRRNGSLGRGGGNPSLNKRISSSYHSHDYNNYYHPSARSRAGYSARSTQNHDDFRKDQFDYYNNSDKDFNEHDYQQTSQMNDDETPFEFRLEDFPSLPNNPNHQSDKLSSSNSTSSNATISSWNTVVSSNPPRPHSTSPHSLVQTQDSRSDRSRSFNTKNNESKSSTKKSVHHQTSTLPSGNHASKFDDHINQEHMIHKCNLPIDDNFDDGFMQTKQQHRRLKRRNKIKDDSIPSNIGNDEHARQVQQSIYEHDSKVSLTEPFDLLTISASNTHAKQPIEMTDMNKTANNSNRLSSSSANSSDTSDYDDAVDNFDAE